MNENQKTVPSSFHTLKNQNGNSESLYLVLERNGTRKRRTLFFQQRVTRWESLQWVASFRAFKRHALHNLDLEYSRCTSVVIETILKPTDLLAPTDLSNAAIVKAKALVNIFYMFRPTWRPPQFYRTCPRLRWLCREPLPQPPPPQNRPKRAVPRQS